MAVCICFLLLASVFVKTGVLKTKQALGTEAATKAENSLSLWVTIESDTQVSVSAQGMGSDNKKRMISLEELKGLVENLRTKNPALTTALIFPQDQTNYKTLIKTMSILRKAQLRDVGLAPL
jgi:biopolymer transport protein ExbD